MKYLKRINESPFLYDFDEDEEDSVYKPSTEVQEDIDYIKTLLADIEDNIDLKYEIDGSNFPGLPGDESEEVNIMVYSDNGLSYNGDIIWGKCLNLKDSLPDYEVYLVAYSTDGSSLRSNQVNGNKLSQFAFQIKRTLYVKEELSPDLLRNVGKKLMDYGHFKRGQDMINHAIKSSNLISLDIKYFVGDDSSNFQSIVLTNCIFDKFELGISFENIEHLETDINSAIDAWKNGTLDYQGILCITTKLYFKIDQDIISKELGSEYKFPTNSEGSSHIGDFVFDISSKYDENNDTINFKLSYIPNNWDVFDGVLDPAYTGLPSDRKSALNLKKIITEKIMKDSMFREILTRFIEAAGNGDEYTDILRDVNNIKVNYLYNDTGDIIKGSNSIRSLNLLTGEITDSDWA